MSTSESTCWTVIRAAAAGSSSDRDELARRYLGAGHAYLSARGRGSALRDDLDDAMQEVFVRCFRQGGAVEVPGAGWVPHFHAFLHAVIRNVAHRFESRPVRTADSLPEIAADDASQSRFFDRTWAQALMAGVARLQRQRAAESAAAVRVGVDDLPDTCPYDGCPRPVNGCHVIYSLG
jgi:RNA polymerase sigma-70 factor (ECF subfamily)